MVKFIQAVLVLFVSLMAHGCVGTHAPAHHPLPVAEPLSLESLDAEHQDCDLCARGEAGENLWCDECGVGYVGGEKVAGEACFACRSGDTIRCGDCEGDT